jgi:hypothetical protein
MAYLVNIDPGVNLALIANHFAGWGTQRRSTRRKKSVHEATIEAMGMSMQVLSVDGDTYTVKSEVIGQREKSYPDRVNLEKWECNCIPFHLEYECCYCPHLFRLQLIVEEAKEQPDPEAYLMKFHP